MLFVIEILEASFKATLPLGIVSYVLFDWSLQSGRLSATKDRKSLEQELKALRRQAKKDRKKNKDKKKAKPSGNPVHNKWVKFGGGFYGTMALWTYLVIEVLEIRDFIFGFEGIDSIFSSFGLNLLIGFLVNSLVNFLKALLWFGYWPEALDTDYILVWLALAYGGYWVGLTLARYKAILRTHGLVR